VRNITVVGNNATLQMRRADYAVPSWGSCPSCRPYKKSEWRAGIMIAQSDDLRISGLNIVESGGDGFYIHCAPGCRNLHISDCVADSNYRQGMVGEQSSVTSLRFRLTQTVAANSPSAAPSICSWSVWSSRTRTAQLRRRKEVMLFRFVALASR